MKRYWKLMLLCWASIVFSCESVDVIYDYREQLQSELEVIDQYLIDNNINASIDPSGMRYQVIEEGEEEPRRDGDNLTYHSLVRRMDDGFFESDLSGPTQEFSFEWKLQLRSVINDHFWQSLHEAARHIGKEGRIIMYVPSILANRDRRYYHWSTVNGESTGVWLPPNTIFIVEAQLLEVN